MSVALEFIVGYDKQAKEVHDIAVDKGWWDNGPRNDAEMIALMHSELSEALEALRKDLPSEKIPGYSGVEEELADVIIRIMDYGVARGLDIGRAVVEKVQFNISRTYRHGGKRF